jgi:hypothetical protein
MMLDKVDNFLDFAAFFHLNPPLPKAFLLKLMIRFILVCARAPYFTLNTGEYACFSPQIRRLADKPRGVYRHNMYKHPEKTFCVPPALIS